jgi:hypothetical protein
MAILTRYFIENIPSTNGLSDILDGIRCDMYLLSRKYISNVKADSKLLDELTYLNFHIGSKKTRPRSKRFDMAVTWYHCFKDNVLELRSTYKCPPSLKVDLYSVFEQANEYWLKNRHRIIQAEINVLTKSLSLPNS